MQLFQWVHNLYMPVAPWLLLLLLLFHAKNGFSWKAGLFVLLPLVVGWLLYKTLLWRRTCTPIPVLNVAQIRPNALRALSRRMVPRTSPTLSPCSRCPTT